MQIKNHIERLQYYSLIKCHKRVTENQWRNQACNFNTQKTETGGSPLVQSQVNSGQLGLHSEVLSQKQHRKVSRHKEELVDFI